MSLNELLEDAGLQQVLKEKLAAGEKFEMISLCNKEKMTFEELQKNIT